jgi:hypothetical protein
MAETLSISVVAAKPRDKTLIKDLIAVEIAVEAAELYPRIIG